MLITGICAGMPTLLLPYLTKHLTTSDYGILMTFASGVSFLTIISGLSTHAAIFKRYFDLSQEEFKEYLSGCMSILVKSSAVIFCVYCVLNYFYSSIFEMPLKWWYLAVCVSFFQFPVLIVLSLFQVSNQLFLFAMIQLGQLIINLSLTYFLVSVLNFGWQGRVLSIAASVIICGLISIFYLRFKYGIRFLFHYNVLQKDALRYSLPLVPHSIGGLLISQADRFLMNSVLGSASTGLYTVGNQISQIILLIADSVNKSYAPWLFSNLRKANDDKKMQIVKFSYLVGTFFLLLPFLLYFISVQLIPFLLPPEYFKVKYFILIQSFGWSFNGLYFIVCNFLFYTGHTKHLAISTLFVGIVHLVLSYSLMNTYGVVGAAIAMSISFLLSFLITWYLSNKVYPLPWLFKVRK